AGWPAAISSMLAAGWNPPAAASFQPSAPARIAPTGALPLPDTPTTRRVERPISPRYGPAGGHARRAGSAGGHARRASGDRGGRGRRQGHRDLQAAAGQGDGADGTAVGVADRPHDGQAQAGTA